MSKVLNVLRVDSSGRTDGSSTRALMDDLVVALENRYNTVNAVRRDLASGMPHVDQSWIQANFTPEEDRTDLQKKTLGFSDSLVEELNAADVLAIGMPVYNFGVPAALKAWVDMIARARLTFRYTENGPVGLLEGKKAYIVVASGGVGVDSEADFATPYMRQALRFVGITDIEVFAADRQTMRGEDALSTARAHIADSIYTTSSLVSENQVA